jgi:hypothetical protein
MQRTGAPVNRTNPVAIARVADVPGRSGTSEHAWRFHDCGGHHNYLRARTRDRDKKYPRLVSDNGVKLKQYYDEDL